MAELKFQQIGSIISTQAGLINTFLVGVKDLGTGSFNDIKINLQELSEFLVVNGSLTWKTISIKLSADTSLIQNDLFIDCNFIIVSSGLIYKDNVNDTYDETGTLITSVVTSDGYTFNTSTGEITFASIQAKDTVYTISILKPNE